MVRGEGLLFGCGYYSIRSAATNRGNTVHNAVYLRIDNKICYPARFLECIINLGQNALGSLH